MAEVTHLFVSRRHRLPMKAVDHIVAVRDRGLEGCAHGRPASRRQVLLMDLETLEEFELAPGTIMENVTTRGLALVELRQGQRLRVGEAVFEVALPCEPCGRMDQIRTGLQKELRGRRGVLCRVVEGGLIRRGDPIEVFDLAKVAG